MNFQLKSLTISMLAILSSAATYAQQHNNTKFYDHTFFTDSDVNLLFKNMYKKAEIDNQSNQKAWGQTVQLNYSSGLYNNIFAIDVSLFHAFKLHGDQNQSNVDMFPINNQGEADDFGKISYTLKAKITDELYAKYGRMFLNTPLLKNENTDLLPSLTEALHVSYNKDTFGFYGIYANKYNHNDASGFTEFGSSSDNNAVQIIGGHTNAPNNTVITFAYGAQSDFANQFYTDIHHVLYADKGNVHLGAQYGFKNAVGDQKDSYSNNDSIHFYGLKTGFEIQQWLLSFSMVDINGKNGESNAWTSANNDWQGMNEDIFVGYNSNIISQFATSGQKSLQARVDYDFSDMIRGLSTAVSYTTADSDNEAGGETNEKEVNFLVSYEIPNFYGLSIDYSYAKNRNKLVNHSTINTKKHKIALNWNFLMM